MKEREGGYRFQYIAVIIGGAGRNYYPRKKSQKYAKLKSLKKYLFQQERNSYKKFKNKNEEKPISRFSNILISKFHKQLRTLKDRSKTKTFFLISNQAYIKIINFKRVRLLILIVRND